MLFRNFYRCATCGREWTDVWSAQCDDDCPHCGARHMSPYKSEDVGETTTNSVGALKTSDRIRLLNDNFRSTFIGGQVVMTAGVAALPLDVQAHVLIQVQRFADFNADNDPYGEHDFGRFEVVGETFFFKVDYYSPDMQGGSEDPADPEKTTRVLTIMRADEY